MRRIAFDLKAGHLNTEQFILALVMVARKLKPYFYAHTIQVLTRKLMWLILSKQYALGRLVKCFIELSKFDLKYQLRVALKALALADFVVEQIEEPWEKIYNKEIEQMTERKIFVNGSSNEKENKVALILLRPEEQIIEYTLRFQFLA